MTLEEAKRTLDTFRTIVGVGDIALYNDPDGLCDAITVVLDHLNPTAIDLHPPGWIKNAGMRCAHPDRHEPRLVCGYPLPCPWHTIGAKPTGGDR